MHKSTLEQWGLLDEVVTSGSFAKAADATHRSQSSVSYNLALLQERLGVMLLQPQGRKTVLTPAGELLLAQVRPLLKAFQYIESHAESLKEGERTRLHLVVDSIFPRSRLFAVLRQFQQLHPRTQINLTEVLENDSSTIAEADVMVIARRQDITGRGEWLMNIDFVAVAHHEHPLHQQPTHLSEEMLAQYPLIRIVEKGPSSCLPEAIAGEYWTFSTIDAAIEAVVHQVGYGWLPEPHISRQLAEGCLKVLPLKHGARRATPLHLIVKKDLPVIDEPVNTLLTLLSLGN